GFVRAAENTMQGFVSTAKTTLKGLLDPDLAELTARNSFSFSDFQERKTALFLIVPQNRISYYAFLMNLFYTNLFHYCLEDTSITNRSLPVYFLLDEFGHLTIPDFPSIITTTRARKIYTLSDVCSSDHHAWRHHPPTARMAGQEPAERPCCFTCPGQPRPQRRP
ncbi:MAG: type IV secretory system conjugative DNA transfer family protein, partial [Alphaproteobacteria bacterium]|nr:type IV secretory system conjugative DNA transfer family protein [Alphaproteobacteria bacterium]